MPQDRSNPIPFPTAEEVEAAPGDRAIKAARNIVSRRIEGIPKRGYIMGECDHAPVVKGIRDLTEAIYDFMDKLDGDDANKLTPETREALNRMDAILDDHRCPEAAPAAAEGE